MAWCSWQAASPGRYSFGGGKLLVDTVELPEADEAVVAAAAADWSGSQELGQDQGLQPGRRVEGNSGTAAAAAEGQAEGLQAENCIQLKNRRGIYLCED